MEIRKTAQWLKELVKKENSRRLLVALGLCGIALLALSSWWDTGSGGPPAQVEEDPQDLTSYVCALEQDLARVVSAITGEKDPVVMVTLENNGRQVYAADRKEGSQATPEGGSSREEESAHVLLEDSEGAQHPLSVTQVQPKVQGVVIVTKHAQDPAVREKLVNAAKTALGISSARVCVTD